MRQREDHSDSPIARDLPRDDRAESNASETPAFARELSKAISLVRRAVVSVDLAWSEARVSQAGFTPVFELVEASHSLHRALAVLVDQPSEDITQLATRFAQLPV